MPFEVARMKKIYGTDSVLSGKALNGGRMDKKSGKLQYGLLAQEPEIATGMKAAIASFGSGYLDMAFTFKEAPPDSIDSKIFCNSLDTLYMSDIGRKNVLEYTENDLLDILGHVFKSKQIRSVEPGIVKKRVARGGIPVYIIE